MSEFEQALRETARQLLADDGPVPGVDLIIGYERGTLPLRTAPCFIRDPEQVDRLVWNASCENNLATYLHHVTGRVGIVAKGCDTRAIVEVIVEQQILRENVVIIGVPCQGIVDRRRIEAQLNGHEVLEVEVANGQVVLRGADFEQPLDMAEALYGECAVCLHRTPSVYDILIGEPGPGSEAGDEVRGECPSVQELESWSAEERWAYFRNEFSRCIRCYACRQACPACYCTECFIDQSQPSWFDKSDDLSDVMAFHLVRLYHVAGRCLDCGACARACPMHIDLRTLGRKLDKDIRELYSYEAGTDLDSAPLLGTFLPNDPQSFIK
jgi:formate dehydrogenase subunit beta